MHKVSEEGLDIDVEACCDGHGSCSRKHAWRWPGWNFAAYRVKPAEAARDGSEVQHRDAEA
jgi:hypothetical protein